MNFCRSICGIENDVAILQKSDPSATAMSFYTMVLGELAKKGFSGQQCSDTETAIAAGMKHELAWMRYGKPYFNVCTPLLGVLGKTPLDIPFSDFKMPFPAFSVCLQFGQTEITALRGSYVREFLFHHYTGNMADTVFKSRELFERQMKAAHEAMARNTDPKYDQMKAYVQEQLKATEKMISTPAIGIYGTMTNGPSWDGEASRQGTVFTGELRLEKGQTIQAAIDSAPIEVDAARRVLLPLFHIAAGVAMIGTADPFLVRHDWPAGWEKRRRLSRKHRERVDSQLESMGRRHGYVVGEEKRLPFHVEHVDSAGMDREPTGRELEYGHWRRAYWGWRHCREGQSIVWRLRPIRMARVRADLPLKPSSGYEIAGA